MCKNSVVKIWQLVRGALAAGGPSHGKTGAMDNPALLVLLILIALHPARGLHRILDWRGQATYCPIFQ